MYSWETRGDAPQRIWYLSVDEKGKVKNRPLYKEKDDEWVTHEVFMGPDHILFNVMGHLDRLQKNPTGIFSLNIRNGEVKKYDQADGGGYWHAAGTKDKKWAVGDTFNGNLYRINLENGEVRLLTTGHRPNSKSPFTSEAHSHHSISPDGKWVLFNSSMLTKSDIMLVPLHPE
jgi:oligogalacturonide lyase